MPVMSIKTSYKPRKKWIIQSPLPTNKSFSCHYLSNPPTLFFIRIKKTVINACCFSNIVRVHYNFIITLITDIGMHTMIHNFSFNPSDRKCYSSAMKQNAEYGFPCWLAVFPSHQILFRNMDSLMPYSKFPYLRFSKSTCMYMKGPGRSLI